MTFEELKTFFFLYCLFTWTAAFLAPLVISFHDFLVLFFFLRLRRSSCILPVYLIAICVFYDISLIYNNNNNKK